MTRSVHIFHRGTITIITIDAMAIWGLICDEIHRSNHFPLFWTPSKFLTQIEVWGSCW
jgi:hypothetical protein